MDGEEEDLSGDTIVPGGSELYDQLPEANNLASDTGGADSIESYYYQSYLRCRRGSRDRAKSLPSVHGIGGTTYRLLGRNFNGLAMVPERAADSKTDLVEEDEEEELDQLSHQIASRMRRYTYPDIYVPYVYVARTTCLR